VALPALRLGIRVAESLWPLVHRTIGLRQGRINAFGDYTFQSALPDGVHDLAQSAGKRLRQQHAGVPKKLLEQCPPVFQWPAHQVLAIEVQQVERIVRERPTTR